MAARRMKAPERRQQIMAVAQRLFARHGYSQTTTAAIAAAAGVTEPILYRHFKSKRDLFLQLLQELTEHVTAQLRGIVAKGQDPAAQIKLLITHYPRLAEQYAEPFAMINRALASLGPTAGKGRRAAPDVRPPLARHYAAYEELASDIVRRGQKSGQFRKQVDASLAAWYLIQIAIGHTMSRPLEPAVFKRKDFVTQSLDVLLSGIMADKAK